MRVMTSMRVCRGQRLESKSKREVGEAKGPRRVTRVEARGHSKRQLGEAKGPRRVRRVEARGHS